MCSNLFALEFLTRSVKGMNCKGNNLNRFAGRSDHLLRFRARWGLMKERITGWEPSGRIQEEVTLHSVLLNGVKITV